MHKRQKTTFISVSLVLGIGAGLLLPSSAHAEDSKRPDRHRPSGITTTSATTQPMGINIPSLSAPKVTFSSSPAPTAVKVTTTGFSSYSGESGIVTSPCVSTSPTLSAQLGTLSSGTSISNGLNLSPIPLTNTQSVATGNVTSGLTLSSNSGPLQTLNSSYVLALKSSSPPQLSILSTTLNSSAGTQLSSFSSASTNQVLSIAFSEGAKSSFQAFLTTSAPVLASSATASTSTALISSWTSAGQQAATTAVMSSGSLASKLPLGSQTISANSANATFITIAQPQILFPAHSIDNVLSLPSDGSFSLPENYTSSKTENAQNIGIESKKSEVSIETPAKISENNSLKAGNFVQNFKKSLRTQVKEGMAAGKVVCQKNKELNKKINAELSSLSENLSHRSKTALVDFMYNVKTSWVTFEKIKDKNKELAKKALPILKQLVLDKLFDSIPANDTVDTVFYTYPAPAVPLKDPLKCVPIGRLSQSMPENHSLYGIIPVLHNNFNPGPISENTQFIDYLKPINDHLVQNGLSPPLHRLYSRIHTSFFFIRLFRSGRTALTLGRTYPVDQCTVLPLTPSSSFSRSNRSLLLRNSLASSSHVLFSLLNHSLFSGSSFKPMLIGFFRFPGPESTAGMRIDYKGGVR